MHKDILWIGDLHLDAISEYSKIDAEYQSSNTRIFDNTLNWICNLIFDSPTIKLVVLSGDIYNHNGYVDPVSKVYIDNFMRKLIGTCEVNKLDIIILRGNHDYYDKNVYVSLLKYLEGFSPRCLVVDKEPLIKLYNFQDNLSRIGFFPYTHEPDHIYTSVSDNELDIAFTHHDVLGGMMTPKIASNKGIEIENFVTKKPIDIINGHYHHFSEMKHNDVRLLVPGAPWYRNHTDIVQNGHKRGIMFYDTCTGDYEIIPNPFTEIYLSVYSSDITELGLLLQPEDVERTRVKIHTRIGRDPLMKTYGGLLLKFLSFRVYEHTNKIEVRTTGEVVSDKPLSFVEATNRAIDKLELEEGIDKEILKNMFLSEVVKINKENVQ